MMYNEEAGIITVAVTTQFKVLFSKIYISEYHHTYSKPIYFKTLPMELKTDLIVNTNSNHQSSLLLFLQNKIILVQTSLFHHKIENLKNILHHIDYYAKFFSLFRSKWIKVCFISPKEKKTFVCNKCLINTKMKSCCAVFFQ